jgi:glycosyltransferase involved in cell wall biosynthesis
MIVSVVICTHNPDRQRLVEVLASLRAQTLADSKWDLLIVDNASTNGVIATIDLSWHPAARAIVESKLGLTNARLRAIADTTGDPIVFVDDDNVLAPDYLEQCAQIAARCSWIGAWGGEIVGRFEVAPQHWHERYLPLLALRTVTAEQWTNVRHSAPYEPSGAGLVVRRLVAEAYMKKVHMEPWRCRLDRSGINLISGGDHDLVRCCSLVGLGWGVFPTLRMEHLIPANRLQWPYLMRLVRGIVASNTLLALAEGSNVRQTPGWRRAVRVALLYLRGGRRAVGHYLAEQAGIRDGKRLYQSQADARRQYE